MEPETKNVRNLSLLEFAKGYDKNKNKCSHVP